MSPHTSSIRTYPARAGSGAWLRLTVVIAVAAAILTAVFLAASPHAHREIHADADHHDHVCAITLLALGCLDAPLPGPLVTARAPELDLLFALPEPREVVWSAPDYWHPPANGPPGC